MNDFQSKMISIIIPDYNGEDCIYDCLDSLLQQTIENIEIIFIKISNNKNKIIFNYCNEKCTLLENFITEKKTCCEKLQENIDKNISYNIINELEEKYNNKVVIYNTNDNIIDTINTAIKNSKGDFISFLMPIESISPCFYRNMLNSFFKYNSDLTSYEYSIKKKVDDKYVQNTIKNNPPCNIYIWNKLFKKEIINNFEIKFNNIEFGSDIAFTMEYLFHCNSITLIYKNISFYVEKMNYQSLLFRNIPSYDFLINSENHILKNYEDKNKPLVIPYVSVIIPVRNKEDSIYRCIDSIINQTENNIEILIIGYGNFKKYIDFFDSLCVKYKNYVKIIKIETLNIQSVYNFGIREAKGEFISFVYPTDYLSLNFYEHMLWSARRDKADIVQCICIDLIKENDMEIENIYSYYEDNEKLTPIIYNKIFRRKTILEKNIFFNENFQYGNEAIFVEKYSLNCDNIAYINRALYYQNINMTIFEFSNRKNPMISVIIPVYNGKKYIKKCLSSVLNQTITDIEIIIVNDGSTDETRSYIENIIENKIDKRIIFVNKRNGGVSQARNFGLSCAKGKFISFIDADDYIDHKFYEHMVWNIKKLKSDLVECGRFDIKESKKKFLKKSISTCKEHIIDMTKKKVIDRGTPFVWDKLFKREIIDRFSISFDEDIKYAEDFLFVLSYKLHCKSISYVHKNLYYYREERENSATFSNENVFDIIKTIEKCIKITIKNGCFRETIGDLGRISAGFYVRRIYSFVKRDYPFQDEFIKQFLIFFKNNIPNWKDYVCAYRSKGSKIKKLYNLYRLSEKGVHFFLVITKFIKFFQNLHINAIKVVYKFLPNTYNNFKKLKIFYKNQQIINTYEYYRTRQINENDVLLVSFFGANVSDSIFYMAKAMEKTGKNIFIGSNYIQRDRVFCEINNIHCNLVLINSPNYLESLACSKYLVSNSRFPDYFNKRNGQILLNTWHGTPIKTLGRNIRQGLRDLGNNQCQFLMSDYILFPNKYTEEKILDAFFIDKLYHGKTILCGYPRNSVFFYSNYIEKIKIDHNLSDKKIFIYMPTWRGETLNTRKIKEYGEKLSLLFEKIDKAVTDDIVIFVKLHQTVMNKIIFSPYKHIRPFDMQYDTYYFLNIADCLITDYSSVMFDFINTDKPIMLFMYDYYQYQKTRGTYFDIRTLNFEKSYTVEELTSYINNFIPHRCRYKQEQKKFCSFDSIDTPELINNVLFKDIAEKQVIIKNINSKTEKYNLYLMPQLGKDKYLKIFLDILENDKYAVFVFAQDTFTSATEKILQKYNDKIIYIITPINGFHSIKQLLLIQLFLWNINLGNKNIFFEDINRLSRGLNINNIINKSRYKWFRFLDKSWKVYKHIYTKI